MKRNSGTVETGVSAAPTHYTWYFPGAPIRVRLELRFVERLEKDLRSGEPANGLLLGDTTDWAANIVDFKPLSGSVQPSSADSLPPNALGYYRTTPEPDLKLEETDIKLFEALFTDPKQIFLLIHRQEDRPAKAAIFFWSDGRIFADFALMEFPFDASLLSASEQRKMESAQAVETLDANSPEPSSSSISSKIPGARKRTSRVGVWAWVLLLLLLLCGGGLVAIRRIPIARPVDSAARADDVAPNPTRVEAGLGLQAERHNGDLKLTWNRQATPILNADSGVLSIADGEMNRKITLDAGQVRSGSILYVPTGDQIRMQLTVLSAQGETSESVMVLLPGRGARQALLVHKSDPERPAGQNAPPALRSSVQTKPFIPPAESKTVQPPETVNAPPPESGIASKVSFLPPAILNVPAELPQSPAVSGGGPPSSVIPVQHPDPPHTPSLEAPYTPPVIVTKVMPPFPPALKPVIFKRKTVSVKLQIDEKGKVTSAEAYPSKEWTPQAITTAAIQAARLWRFKPAMRGTRPVPGEAMVEFVFDPPR